MKLYKFKGGGDALYTLDIAMNERLYCAKYRDLNDPFEGQFQTLINRNFLGGMPLNLAPLGGMPVPVTVFSAIEHLDELADKPSRVCSLTTAWEDVRMWALYGDSSRGVAFEFEVDESHPNLHRVEYLDGLPQIGIGLLSNPAIEEVLGRKTKHWEYEKEWRFISADEYVDVKGKLTRVLIGNRAAESLKQALVNLTPAHADVYMIELNHLGLRMELGERLRQRVSEKHA
ncbi:DUF2971 domain-containing protein [Stenotrophomonas maltophilia]|nr:DUF2971 domain-containing protein [Stenotrophomonas maltophilia]HDS1142364.1 DUF2971 domain-containing protein [Stenotrophomonas maltophilia]